MSANRITISIYLGTDEVEYSCQYLKHNEGINRLYHGTCHIEYDANDGNVDISTLKNNLTQIKANNSIKARIEVNYLDLNKTLYIQGSIYAFKVNSTAGSTLTTYVLYLSHETRPMTLSHFSGVSYQAQAKDMIERRLINQSESLNLSDYTEFFEKVNYKSEARFPAHPMIVQWRQSSYDFIDRVLGTHGLWYQLYSHKGGVDFVIGDNNQVFSGHSDEIKDDEDKSFYFDDDITISLQNKQSPEAAYQYHRIYNGCPIVDIEISPNGKALETFSIFECSPFAPLHYIDYEALKRKLSDKRSQQQNHQQLGGKLHRENQKQQKHHSALFTQQKKQTVSKSHSDYISYRHVDEAKKQMAQSQQTLASHQSGHESIQAEIDQLSQQVGAYEAFYEQQQIAKDKNFLQYASFRQFENIRFYHTNQDTPSQEMTDLLPLAFTDKDKAMKPYITQDFSIQGDQYFPVVNREQFEVMVQTQQEQIIWNNSPRFVASFQGYVLRAGTIINVALNRDDDFPNADTRHFQDYSEYLITDVLYEYTAERNQRGHAKLDNLGRVTNYQEKHTVMGSFPKCDYRPLVNTKKLIKQATNMSGVKPYQICPASFEVVPNKNGYIPIQLPLDYQENVGSSCYYAPRLSSSNTGKMNQSHPIYPDTELMVSFLEGNPETPIIRGAVANKATGHVNNQSQDKRMMLTSPQGHMFSNTLNAGDDNSSTLKTKHGFQTQKGGSHQSYVNLSNIGSTTEEGKKQLDITEATTANKTLKAGNKFEQYSGVTNNDTSKPNYGLIIDPNVEEPEQVSVVSQVAEALDRQLGDSKTVQAPSIVNSTGSKAPASIHYQDFLGRSPDGMTLKHDNGMVEDASFNDNDIHFVHDASIVGEHSEVYLKPKDSHRLEAELKTKRKKLKGLLNKLYNQAKNQAIGYQSAFDDSSWYEKPFLLLAISAVGVSEGFYKSVASMLEGAKDLALHPVDTANDISQSAEEVVNIMSWIMRDEKTWGIILESGNKQLALFDKYPIYGLEKGSRIIGSAVTLIVAAMLTEGAALITVAKGAAGVLKEVSSVMVSIAKIISETSRKTIPISKSVSKGTRVTLESRKPPIAGNVAKPKSLIFLERQKAINFYQKHNPSMDIADIESHILGIDFTKSVEVVELPKGTQLIQYTKTNTEGKVLKGDYYTTDINATPNDLGISEKYSVRDTGWEHTNEIRSVKKETINLSKNVSGLKSKAAEIEDTWSLKDTPIPTEGGGTQVYIPKSQF